MKPGTLSSWHGGQNDYRHGSMDRICLVICFMGPLPKWLPFYFKSCQFNTSIDFLIFADEIDALQALGVPPNVRLVYLDLPEFCRQASQAFNITISFKRAYKLCDFKPAYGVLFQEYLKGYEFWGYTDLDVIYGDIRKFLGIEALGQYDVITSRSEFLAGHFTLIRNEPQFNRLYEQSCDYLRVFSSRKVAYFDECGNTCWGLMRGEKLSQLRAKCDSMTHVVRRLSTSRVISSSFKTLCCDGCACTAPQWEFCWQKGTLYNSANGLEVMYLHFNTFKKLPGFMEPQEQRITDSFYINQSGFVMREGSLT